MKKIIITAVILASSVFSFGQESSLEPIAKINLGLQGIDFSYELPISKNLLWESSIGAGVGMNVYQNTTEYVFYFLEPAASVSTGIKWNYNIDKRKAKEKTILNNSGNYLGIQSKYGFGNNNKLNINNVLLTDLHWGLQRSISSKFIFNANVGLGYMHDFDTSDGGIAPVLRIKLGYRLF